MSPGLSTALNTRVVRANGLDFGILEMGSGPLALCLHGFPDSAYTWRYLLPALSDAGFHAVAPFMRGYAPTAIPADACYQVGALVADVVALHETLGADRRAILVGHDWGAEAAYGAAAFAPDRWSRVVTIGVPPYSLDARLFADYDQLKRFFSLFLLRSSLAESVVAANDMAFLDRLWGDWSPGYDASESLRHVKRCLRERDNLNAALGYYRTDESELSSVSANDPYAAEQAALTAVGPQPTLYLHGEIDGCIDLALVGDVHHHLAPGSAMKVVKGAGHFLHLENPIEVNRHVLSWVAA